MTTEDIAPQAAPAAKRHPLFELIVSALGLTKYSNVIIDAEPREDGLVVLYDSPPVLDFGNNPWYESVLDEGSATTTAVLYSIPVSFPVVLYRLQQAVEQHEGRDPWERVFIHMLLPSTYATDGDDTVSSDQVDEEVRAMLRMLPFAVQAMAHSEKVGAAMKQMGRTVESLQ